MRSLKIHSIRAQGILCFGPKGIEIHFSDYGPVVQIKGVNLDYPYSEDDPHASSNATGKSSLQELLSIGFYGRTVKSPTKNKGAQIINCLSNKGEIEILWDDCRLLRSFTRSKNGSIKGKLQFWKSPNKIWDKTSEVTSVETQEAINEKLGLTHHAFCNVVIFDDINSYSFLEADTPTKREIVENLLDLDQYREYHANSKELVKETKLQIDLLSREYNVLQDDVASTDRRIVSVRQQEVAWKIGKEEQIKALGDRLVKKQRELETTDSGSQLANWDAAQARIADLSSEIVSLEDKRQRIDSAVNAAKEKTQQAREGRDSIAGLIQEHRMAMQEAATKIKQSLKLVSQLEGMKDGASCPWCYGVINRENYGPALHNARNSVDKHTEQAEKAEASAKTEETRRDEKSQVIANMESKIREAEGKVALIESTLRKNRSEITQLSSIPKPEGNVAEQVLEAEIVELRKQIKSRQEELEGDSPYKQIIASAEVEKAAKETERDNKAAELQKVEEKLPYYQYWVEAFGDNGIRKFVIDGIIPSLNERIAYWLQILIEGKLELSFNNKLDETITRNGNPASYSNMSGGERRRINLAVSQAFAYVMMLNSGSCPSLVFLDEVTGGSIDRAGVSGIYNMIFELAKERQVLVTTHNENLMSLLQGCETITLKKENDITVLHN